MSILEIINIINEIYTVLFFFFFLGMQNSKMSLQPQHTESPRTTAQNWESESAVTFSVELPSLITECIRSTEPRPAAPHVKGISAEVEVVVGYFPLLDICQGVSAG